MTVALQVIHTKVSAIADGADTTLVRPSDWNADHTINGVTQINTELAGKVATTLTLTAGAGLTGGGDLSANRTFDVGAGAGISVAADAVALDTAHVRNVDHTGVSITAGNGLSGGGDISTTRTLTVNQGFAYSWTVAHTFQAGLIATEIASPSNPAANNLHVFAKDVATITHLFTRDSAGTEVDLSLVASAVQTSRTLTAGAGLTGGGTLAADRTFDVIGSTSIIVGADDVQRAALTGDVTAAQNVNATTIAANVVDNTKLADMVQATIKGRASGAGTGDPTDLIGAQVLTIAGAQAADATLTALAAFNANGLLTQTAADTFASRAITATATQITVTNGDGVAGNPALSFPADILVPTVLTVPNVGLHLLDTDATHDLIIKPGSNLTADRIFTLTTGDAARTLTINADTTLGGGTHSGTNTGDQTITLTGDVTGSGVGSFTTSIAANVVTNVDLADVATATFKGRTTAGTGDPEDLTVAQAKTLLNLTGTNSGDQTITLTSDVTGSGTGSFAATIAADAVTNTKLANVNNATLKGRITASAGDPEDLTGTQATTLLDVFTSTLKGLVPSGSGGSTVNYLRGDGTWQTPPGSGAQPLDATLTALAALDTTAGVLAQTGTDTFAKRTITGTANQIAVANGTGASANPTLSLDATDIIVPAILTTPNSGLHILDTNASHDLIIKPGSDLTADRIFTITTGDSARILTMNADTVLAGGTHSGTNTGDQSLAGLQPLDADLTSWAAITRASGFDTFATTPSSANLAALVTNETGSGALVFADSPTLSGTIAGTLSWSGVQTVTNVTNTDGAGTAGAFNVSGGLKVAKDVFIEGSASAGLWVGSGAGNRIITINGASSGTGFGGGIQLDLGGALAFALGNLSSIEGTAYNNTVCLKSNFGFRWYVPAGAGYGPAGLGVGGTVTQTTSKSNAVTLHKICGEITTHNAALAGNTTVSFTMTNNVASDAGDVVIYNIVGPFPRENYQVWGGVPTGGVNILDISLRNMTAGSLSDAVVIRFAIIKGVIT